MSSPSYYRAGSFDTSSSASDLDRFFDERGCHQEVNVGLASKANEHHCHCGAPGGDFKMCLKKGCKVMCSDCGVVRSSQSSSFCMRCHLAKTKETRDEKKAQKQEEKASRKRKAGNDSGGEQANSRKARKPKHTARQKELRQQVQAAAHDANQVHQGGIVKMAKARTIPTMYGSTGKPCSSHFIKKFDRFIRSIDPDAVFARDWMDTDGAYDEDVEMADEDVMGDDDEDDGMHDGHLWKDDNQFMEDAVAGRRLRHIDNLIGMVVRRRCRY